MRGRPRFDDTGRSHAARRALSSSSRRFAHVQGLALLARNDWRRPHNSFSPVGQERVGALPGVTDQLPHFDLRAAGKRFRDVAENMSGDAHSRRSFEEILATVAARVRAARKAKGYNQKDLAARADTSQTYISELEQCAANPSLLTLFRLAEALEVDVASLFETDEQ
jgi:DNA-binding XRE family transcriptional regulator